MGEHAADLDIGEKATKITRVNILVDDEHQYTAGDDTGRTLEKTVPWGSQEMAESILAAVRGIDYQPFVGTDALIDPAAEIGDGVTVGGIYSVLAQKDIAFGKLTTTEISAPSTDEIEDEYPYQSRQLRQQQRQVAQTRSMIVKSADSITQLVEDTEKNLSSTIEQTAAGLRRDFEAADQGLSTTIEETAKGIRQTITDTKNDLSTTIETTASGIRKDFEAADTELGKRTTTIEETIDGITVSGEGGTTYIKPGAIQANSITGSMIKGGTITADDIETGSITASCLSFSVYDQSQTKSEIQSQITALKNGLTLTVTNNRENTSATLQLLDNKIELDSAEINLTGLVTVNALQTSGGGVTINGDNITAGKISGSLINGEGLNISDKFIVSDGNITIKNCSITLQDSSVTGGMIKDNAVTSGKINSGAVTEGKIAADAVTSTKIAAGAVTAGKINAKGLRIGPSDEDIQFEVTETGQVNIKGNVKISGSISWDNVTGTSSVTNGITSAQNAASAAQSTANSASTAASAAQSTANSASTAATNAANDVAALAGGTYKPPSFTFISEKQISSPTIIGGTIQGTKFIGEWFNVNTENGGGFKISAKSPTDDRYYDIFTISGSFEGWGTPNVSINAPYANIGTGDPQLYINPSNLYLISNVRIGSDYSGQKNTTLFENTNIKFTNSTINFTGCDISGLDGKITAKFA